MPRLCALLLLAGIAASALTRRRPVAVQAEHAAPRPLTPAECRLLFWPSPSKARH